MSATSKIEWTEATWNPVSGCTRVSAGCDHCYAVTQTHRLEGMGQVAKYGGLTVLNPKGARHFNGQVRCHEDALAIPLRRRKPTVYFVNSMSDLFHPGVPFEFIDRVFAVMALTPQHTYQILTKRPERMAEYLTEKEPSAERSVDEREPVRGMGIVGFDSPLSWPLPNVWLGTSVEDQAAADERSRHLREVAIEGWTTFWSAEPLLGPVRIPDVCYHDSDYAKSCWLDWVIVGGESGPGARPCNIEWLRSILEQCRAAGVAAFVKQVGSRPVGFAQWDHEDNEGYGVDITGKRLHDRKGGDPSEWPEDLRVRELPGPGAHRKAVV